FSWKGWSTAAASRVRMCAGSGGIAVPILSIAAGRHRGDCLDVEAAYTQQLMDIPFNQLILPVTAGDEGFLVAQRVEVGPGHVPEHDDPKVAVAARAGDQRLAGELLLPYPCQVIIDGALDRLLAITNPPVQGQVPHFRPPAIGCEIALYSLGTDGLQGTTSIRRMRRWLRR